MVRIDVNTRLVGLLGFPLGHSYSPVMQNRAFEALGLNYVYIPIEVTPEDLGDVVRGMCKMNFAGFNVTIPHKVSIMGYLDGVDDRAAAIGSVNTVTIRDGRSMGYNTDGQGFVTALESQTGVSVKDKNIFILGSGGASRAIAVTLAFKGASRLYICNRTEEKARELAEVINNSVRPCSTAVPMEYEPMGRAIDASDILVNTTSVGMFPRVEEMPLADKLIKRRLMVCDIVYNPPRTRLLLEAEKAGCKTVGGMGMLVSQGAAALKLWTGLEPPVREMYETLTALAR